MSKSVKKTLMIAGVYIGSVVGAGFASGQEMLQFFVAFEKYGFFGLIISTLLFMLFGYIIIIEGYRQKAVSYDKIITTSCGNFFGKIIDFIITFFLFGSFVAMLAGSGAVFSEQFNIPYIVGVLAMAIFTQITVLLGFKGIINSICTIVPLLIISVVFVSIFSIFFNHTNIPAYNLKNFSTPIIGNFLFSSILYTSYNLILSIAVLAPLGSYVNDKKIIKNGAILGGLGLGFIAFLIFITLEKNLLEIENLDVPMLFIAKKISGGLLYFYTIILLLEIYTTAVSGLYGFAKRLSNESLKNYKKIIHITVISAIFFSLIGFTNLVKYLYPIVGYGGIVLMIFLLKAYIRKTNTNLR